MANVPQYEPPKLSYAPDYFDNLYSDNADPWDFAGNWYERRKYTATLSALSRPRYSRCFEAACSIGELSHLLAARCDELVATDCSAVAIQLARARLSECRNVVLQEATLPADVPSGTFDLVVYSEFLYYLSEVDLARVISLGVQLLRPEGELVAVHSRMYGGDQLHGKVESHGGLERVVHHEEDRRGEETFVLDVYRPR